MQLKFLILAGAMCMPAALLAQAAPAPDAASQPARPAFDKADAEKAVADLATTLVPGDLSERYRLKIEDLRREWRRQAPGSHLPRA